MRVLLSLAFAVVGFYLVAGWAQENAPEALTDSQLRTQIDSLVAAEQPLSVAPLIYEAKRRADHTRNTEWMLHLINQEITVNRLRFLRQSSIEDQLQDAARTAWSPIRQMLYLNLYQLTSAESYIPSALADADTLARLQATDVVGNSLPLTRLTLLDYITLSVVTASSYTADELTDEQMATARLPLALFATSTTPLPPVWEALRVQASHAKTDLSRALSVALRSVLCRRNPQLTGSMATLLNDVTNINSNSSEAKGLMAFILANYNINKVADMTSITSRDSLLDVAHSQFLTVVKTLPETLFATEAEAIANTLTQHQIMVATDSEIVPDSYIPLYLRYRNISQARVEVTDASGATLDARSLALPQTRSRETYSSLYTELTGVPSGNYLITVYADGCQAQTTLLATSVAVARITTGSSSHLLLTDTNSGEPIAGATVSGCGTTDNNGLIPIKESKELTITTSGEQITVRPGYYRLYAAQQAEPKQRATILTDRNIYRPTQTIQYKAFLYNAYRNHLTATQLGEQITLQLIDAYGNEIATATSETNIFGTVSGSLHIPDDVARGRAEIVALANGNSLARQTIRIEEYVRPDEPATADAPRATPRRPTISMTPTADARSVVVRSLGSSLPQQLHLQVTQADPYDPLLPVARYTKIDSVACTPHVAFNSVGVPRGVTNRIVYETAIEVTGEDTIHLHDITQQSGLYTVTVTSPTASRTCQLLRVVGVGEHPNLPHLYVDCPPTHDARDTLKVFVGSGMEAAKLNVIVSRRDTIIELTRVECNREVKQVAILPLEGVVDGETLKVAVSVERNGRQYAYSKSVALAVAAEPLPLVLTTSRDYSEPGADELWELRSLPNVEIIASMYDTRLDALANNAWEPTFSKLSIANSLSLNALTPVKSIAQTIKSTYFPPSPTSVVSDSWRLSYLLKEFSYAGVEDEQMHEPRLLMSARANATTDEADEPTATIRSDFRETVFFLPHLTTDGNGNAALPFRMPDNITSYTFRAVAHDKSLRSSQVTRTIRVGRALTCRLLAPRFLTSGDTVELRGVVSQRVADSGWALLTVGDATMDTAHFSMAVDTVRWRVAVPSVDSVDIVLRVATDGYADGERHRLFVRPRTRATSVSSGLLLGGAGQHRVVNPFDVRASFVYCSDPLVEVLRALPVLAVDDEEATDGLLNRLVASAVASHLRTEKSYRDVMDSLGITADDATRLLRALADRQADDGSFAWRIGMQGSAWVTCNIVQALGEMEEMGIISRPRDIFARATPYIDEQLEELERKEAIGNNLSSVIPLLVARMYASTSGSAVSSRLTRLVSQSLPVASLPYSYRPHLALLLSRAGYVTAGASLLRSIEENLVQIDSLRAVVPLRDRTSSEQLIAAQAGLIRVLRLLRPESDNLRRLENHLLLLKRGLYWGDGRQTSLALLTLLQSGVGMAGTDRVLSSGKETVDGGDTIIIEKRDEWLSWGYFIREDSVELGNFWADEPEGVTVARQLAVKRSGTWQATVESRPNVGDTLRVTLRLHLEEPLSFVRLRDYHSYSFEPLEAYSGYRFGLRSRSLAPHVACSPAYYLSFTDGALTYYFEELPRGEYEVEYEGVWKW